MLQNISSHTANDGSLYPAFVNIRQSEKGGVDITTRAPEHVTSGGQVEPGAMCEIHMTMQQFADFVLENAEWVAAFCPPELSNPQA